MCEKGTFSQIKSHIIFDVYKIYIDNNMVSDIIFLLYSRSES